MIRAVMSWLGSQCYEYHSLKQKALLLWSYRYTATVSLYSFLHVTPSPVGVLQIIWDLLGHLGWFNLFAFDWERSLTYLFFHWYFFLPQCLPNSSFCVYVLFSYLPVFSSCSLSLFPFLLPSVHNLNQLAQLFPFLFSTLSSPYQYEPPLSWRVSAICYQLSVENQWINEWRSKLCWAQEVRGFGSSSDQCDIRIWSHKKHGVLG